MMAGGYITSSILTSFHHHQCLYYNFRLHCFKGWFKDIKRAFTTQSKTRQLHRLFGRLAYYEDAHYEYKFSMY